MRKIFAIEYSSEPNIQESYLDKDMFSSVEVIEKSLQNEGFVEKKDSHDNTFYVKENEGQYAVIKTFYLHERKD